LLSLFAQQKTDLKVKVTQCVILDTTSIFQILLVMTGQKPLILNLDVTMTVFCSDRSAASAERLVDDDTWAGVAEITTHR